MDLCVYVGANICVCVRVCMYVCMAVMYVCVLCSRERVFMFNVYMCLSVCVHAREYVCCV